MPDPLSIAGAAAASTQFAEQGLAIAKFLYSTISAMIDAPETVRLRLEQINQMTAIFNSIKQDVAFQTESISDILRACLEELTKLQDMFSRFSVPSEASAFKRWTARLLTVMEETRVETAFSNLDRHKIILLVCMELRSS
jgi:C-terminal processing protease CtpA/Prc